MNQVKLNEHVLVLLCIELFKNVQVIIPQKYPTIAIPSYQAKKYHRNKNKEVLFVSSNAEIINVSKTKIK